MLQTAKYFCQDPSLSFMFSQLMLNRQYREWIWLLIVPEIREYFSFRRSNRSFMPLKHCTYLTAHVTLLV